MTSPTISTNLRLPQALHTQIRVMADADERSVNGQIVYILKQAVASAGGSASPDTPKRKGRPSADDLKRDEVARRLAAFQTVYTSWSKADQDYYDACQAKVAGSSIPAIDFTSGVHYVTHDLFGESDQPRVYIYSACVPGDKTDWWGAYEVVAGALVPLYADVRIPRRLQRVSGRGGHTTCITFSESAAIEAAQAMPNAPEPWKHAVSAYGANQDNLDAEQVTMEGYELTGFRETLQ